MKNKTTFTLEIFIFLLLLNFHSFAQSIDSSTNVMGIFAETNGLFANNVGVLNTIGMMCGKKIKKDLAFSILLGYGKYNNIPNLPFPGSLRLDTIMEGSSNSNMNLGLVGFGIEAERQFYNKLYLFLGVEVRAGYGSGSVDSTITKEFIYPNTNPVTQMYYPQLLSDVSYNKRGPGANMFYAAITPSIGLKLEFRKFSIGAEFRNYFSYISIHSHTVVFQDNPEFSFNNITQRVFIQYRL